MRVVLAFLLLMIGSSVIAQQPIRNQFSTNEAMNAVQDGWMVIWNGAARKWSNTIPGSVTATNAQPPSSILTNLSVTGAITNLNDNQFAAETTIASIKSGALLTNIIIRPSSTLQVPLELWGLSGQANDLFMVRDFVGAPLFHINENGSLFGNSGLGPSFKGSSSVGQIWTASDTTGIGEWQTPIFQLGSASLTNLSGNPNVATNIIGAGSVTVTSNNLGTYTITGTADAGGTNSRQFGSASLTNLSGNPNVVTNILGAGTVTVTSNNLGTFTITGTGGSATTTNIAAFSFAMTPLIQRNADNWADGTNVFYTNVFNSVTGGTTNVYVTNMMEGQTIEMWLYPSNGVTVTFPQFTSSDHLDGSVITPATNIWSRVKVTRRGSTTNILVTTKTYEIDWGNITASTNFATSVITLTAPSGGSITTNENQFLGVPLSIKSGARMTNASLVNMTNTGVLLNSGSITNTGAFTNQGALGVGGSLSGNAGSFTAALTAFTTLDVFGLTTLHDPVDHQTNATTKGTNTIAWLKISGGVPSGSILRTDSNTNVVAATMGNGVAFDGTTLTATGTTNYFGLVVTNQIIRRSENYNGSNGTSAITLTNALDTSLRWHKAVTNDVGTNLTYILSNITATAEFVQVFRGLNNTTNRLTYINPSGGTNYKYLNWETNGTYDVLIRGNYTYEVNVFIDRQTNITFKVFTDDPYVPISQAYLGITFVNTNLLGSQIITNNIGYLYSTSDFVATNGNAVSNLTINVQTAKRDLYITNAINITNITGMVGGSNFSFALRITPLLVNRAVTYPTLGGASHGYRTFTNINSPMWGTLTQGITYRIIGEAWGTNLDLAISEWK